MNLLEISEKIGGRVSDPELQTYEAEAKSYFKQAFVSLLSRKAENSVMPYYADEISPSINFVDNTLYSGITDIDVSSIDNLLYVFSIISSAEFPTDFRYISVNELNSIAKNPNKYPDADIGFWSKLGTKIRVLVNSEAKSRVIALATVIEPNISDWTDATDFSSYGSNFIYECIELASKLLRQQIGMEG